MSDNNRRARAWPRIEGKCASCGRWFKVRRRSGAIYGHICNGVRVGKTQPTEAYDPSKEAP